MDFQKNEILFYFNLGYSELFQPPFLVLTIPARRRPYRKQEFLDSSSIYQLESEEEFSEFNHAYHNSCNVGLFLNLDTIFKMIEIVEDYS